MRSAEEVVGLPPVLADRIAAAAAGAGVPAEVTRAGSIMNVHLSDSGQLADLHLALLLHSVYTTPRGMINLSTALSPGDLDDIASAYEVAFTLVRPALRRRVLMIVASFGQIAPVSGHDHEASPRAGGAWGGRGG